MANMVSASADLARGGAVFETSGGTKIAILASVSTIYIFSDLDGTPTTDDSNSSTTVHGGSGIDSIDAAIDSNDVIHVVSCAVADQTRDIAYCTATESGGTYSFGTWEEAASFTNKLPDDPGVAISIDSNDKPHVLFVDNVKQQGTAGDNVYYTEKTGASWASPTQIGLRGTKTDVYNSPTITLRASNYIEVLYYFSTDGDPAYRTWNGSEWSGEYTVTETSAVIGDVIYDGTNAQHYFADASEYIHENSTSTGYQTHVLYAAVSAAYFDSTRYVFYVDTGSDVHLISNSGSGWTDEGDLYTEYFATAVIAGWQYNNLNNTATIDFLVMAGSAVYWDEWSASGAPYEITPAAGSYSVTGQNPILAAARKLVQSAAGSYSVTGYDVTFAKGYSFSVDAGSYGIVGYDVTLKVSRRLDPDAGSYSVAGQDPTLAKGFAIAPDAGSYAVAGYDVTFIRTYALAAEAGDYSVSGQDPDLVAGRVLGPEAGGYNVTGYDVLLIRGYSILPEAGSYAVAGQDPDLTADRALALSAGSYAIAGQDPALEYSGESGHPDLECDAGSYAITGYAAALTIARKLGLAAGSYSVSGQAITFTVARKISLEAGNYAVNGQAITFARTYVLAAAAGSYIVTGLDAVLEYSGEGSYTLYCDAGSYVVAGQSAALQVARQLAAEAGSYAAAGQETGLIVARRLDLAAGSYALTGQPIDMAYSGFVAEVYMAILLANLTPALILACCRAPSASEPANPSPALILVTCEEPAAAERANPSPTEELETT